MTHGGTITDGSENKYQKKSSLVTKWEGPKVLK
jgi:hypothetical protein